MIFDRVEVKDISLVKWVKISSVKTRAGSFELSVLGHLKPHLNSFVLNLDPWSVIPVAEGQDGVSWYSCSSPLLWSRWSCHLHPNSCNQIDVIRHFLQKMT